MQYYSTRGCPDQINAAEAILRGLAPDGGLFVPVNKAKPFSLEELSSQDYRELAVSIFKPYLSGYPEDIIKSSVEQAYCSNNFSAEEITPLHKLSEDLYILELFHGPTYAFKDIALQVLPYLLTAAIRLTGEEAEIVILTATSGDTGKSALEGFRDVAGTRIVVYYPENGVSIIQERQMTTQEGGNVVVAAVRGNFDAAQSGVKQIFGDRKLAVRLRNKGYSLSSANSINWGRLLPQVVYYFTAYFHLLRTGAIRSGDNLNFVVPTGNFGNILAGWYAKQFGLPVNRLICAANSNNVLADFICSGVYDSRRELFKTISPSMDILVSSNLERLLFELTGHDHEKICTWMDKLRTEGFYRTDSETLAAIQALFWSGYADDVKTSEIINQVYSDYAYLVDTHTAVGKAVLDDYRSKSGDFTPAVLLSTASPFKFSRSVSEALYGKQQLSGLSDFALLKRLSIETGIAVPANLAGLELKAVKHKKVIAPEKMRDHLENILGID